MRQHNAKTYDDKISKELNIFRNNINVNDLPEAFHYLSNKFLKGELERNIGVSSSNDLAIKYINLVKEGKPETDIKILSLGSGNCDTEINLVADCNFLGKVFCYEINPNMLERGRQKATERGVNNFEFIQADINKIILRDKFDIVLANHSLHHFVELEHIFGEVNESMTESSFFIVNDMIGRNGHMFWDNTLQVCNAIWNIFPKELKYNHQFKKYIKKRIQWDCSSDGFEGIRAQDILPLLDKTFKFKDFAPFFPIITKFVDRDFGHNFDLNNDFHRSLLDMIGYYDNYVLKNKILKPTQLIATMVRKDAEITEYKYMYFKDPKEVYMQDEKRVWDYFDRVKHIF